MISHQANAAQPNRLATYTLLIWAVTPLKYY